MVKFIPSHKYLEGERPNFACRVIWFQRPSSFHIPKGTPDSNERFLRRGATERRPLKRTVSFTGQPPLAPLVCVCVRSSPFLLFREHLFHSCGPFRAICFSAFSTIYFSAPVSSVRAEGRGRMLTLYLRKCGEMSYWPYG